MTPKPHKLTVNVTQLGATTLADAKKAAGREAIKFFGEESADKLTYQCEGSIQMRIYSGVVYVYYDEYEDNKEETNA